MPVTVDTPLGVTDQTTFMTVVGKHKPREGGRGEDGREAKERREVDFTIMGNYQLRDCIL